MTLGTVWKFSKHRWPENCLLEIDARFWEALAPSCQRVFILAQYRWIRAVGADCQKKRRLRKPATPATVRASPRDSLHPLQGPMAAGLRDHYRLSGWEGASSLPSRNQHREFPVCDFFRRVTAWKMGCPNRRVLLFRLCGARDSCGLHPDCWMPRQ